MQVLTDDRVDLLSSRIDFNSVGQPLSSGAASVWRFVRFLLYIFLWVGWGPVPPIVNTLRGLQTSVWGLQLRYGHAGLVCWFAEACVLFDVLS